MCINCNLLCPITDAFAEFLGVEKRKYLGFGSQLHSPEYADICHETRIFTTSNSLYNFKTVDFFEVPNMDEFIEKKVEKNGYVYKLYEGKLKVRAPLPIQYKFEVPPENNWETYLNLIEGTVEWAENPPEPVPEEGAIRSNKYKQKVIVQPTRLESLFTYVKAWVLYFFRLLH